MPRWDPTPTWASLLALLVIVAAALAAFALAQAIRVQTVTMRARRSGYPVKVCLDVAFDGHRDTASLVNGAGAFASLAEPVRERVRRWRRQRAAIGALAPVLTVVLAVAWLVLASTGGAHPERVVSAAAFALLLLPLGVGLLAYVLLAAREGSAVPQARLPWRQWLGRRRQPLVIRAVAVHWLRGADEAEPAQIGRDRWALAGGHGVLGLLLVCLVLVMALVAYVSFSASMTVALNREVIGEWEGGVRQRAEVWQAVDSAVRTLGVLPAATTADTEAAAMVVRLMTGDSLPTEESRLWSVPAGTPAVSLPGYASDSGTYFSGRFLYRRAYSPPTLVRQSIERNVTSSGYQAWRRFSRAAPPPLGWYFTPEFGGLGSNAVLGQYFRLASLERLRATALGEILLAAERGDRARALATVGELLAAGLTLGREPIPVASDAGDIAVRTGLSALRSLVRRGGLDPGLEARAGSVLELERTRFGTYFDNDFETDLGAPILLTSDPTSASTREALAGPSQYWATGRPVDRWRLISAVAPAFCISPREVLLGLDPQRGAALESALGRNGDLPRTDEWIRANLRWFEQLRDDPGSAGVRTDPDSSARIEVPWPLKPLGWVGLGKLRDRIAFCRQYVWY